ncbi:MAG: cupin domain-containing protein [Pseudomonadota bacterium]
MQLGADVRSLRKAQQMTLADLADASNKSVSFLSKIERGLARPSVTALQEIAEALGVPAGWFFDSDGPVSANERPYVVRADRRRKLSFSNLSDTSYMGLEDHLLSASLDGNLALGISTYQAGGHSGDDLSTHDGEEAGLILKGTIRLTIDGETFDLKAGDSFSFSAAIPHRYENVGADVAQIVWANTPITLRRL